VGIRVALGRLALARRDLAGAAAVLAAAAEKGPRDPAAQAALGDLRLAEGKREEAEASYRRALELDGEFAPAELGLARLALERGDAAAARAGLERTLAIDPGSAEAQGALGLLLWRAGDLPGAEAALTAAVAAAPKDALLRVRLGAVKLERGDAAGAVAAAEAGSNLDPGLAEGHHWLGRAILARGETSAALVQLSKAVELEPTNASYLIHLGLGRERASALGEAIEAYTAAAAADPRLPDPHERLGRLYAQNDRCDKAVAAFEKALALAPGAHAVKVALADCRMATRKAPEAVRLLKEVQKADPSLPVTYRLARAVHEAQGFAAALPWYEKAVKAEPENPMPHYYLGYAYKERRDRARALQEFKAYLAKRPDADDKVDIQREIEDLGGK
jgi:tetratricopeptide (TPR) repeat protein